MHEPQHIDAVTAMILRDGVIKDLTEDAKTINTEVKAGLVAEGMKPAERKAGWVGDVNIGGVTRSNPKPSLEVHHDPDLFDWVLENHPDAIEQRVSPNWIAQVKKNGGVLDEETGELVIPDGMVEMKGSPRFSITRTDEGRALTRQIASRIIGTALELESGE